MAKMTKAQARKRLKESRVKILKVAVEHPSPAFTLKKAVIMADELQKAANKLK